MSWISTYTGKKFFPFNPRAEDVDIRDIAHSLSLSCRFLGHSSCHYSIAQHALLGAYHASTARLALLFLHHDDEEAYLPDMPAPIKRLDVMAPYRSWGHVIQRAVARGLNLPTPTKEEKAEIKALDLRCLATEARCFMNRGILEDWDSIRGIEPFGGLIGSSVNKRYNEELYLATHERLVRGEWPLVKP